MPVKKMLDELHELQRDLFAFGTGVADAVAESTGWLHDLHSFVPEPVWGAALTMRHERVVERCQRITLLYQPVARDFQNLTAVLRVASELEQIGHLAAEITEQTSPLASLPEATEKLPQLADSVSNMVHTVVDAYSTHNTIPARQMAQIRTDVADATESVIEWLTGVMKVDSAAVEPGLSLFAVVRNLQAMANHTTRLAEALSVVENRGSGSATRIATGTEALASRW
ncbi:Phosphate-specific transport system accessory protein PhoU OS=Planctomyces brasiliensis (strain ATCC 49424 / DSM 5305 / JCM 21570 / NBRC 103401 / IFAM 1448) GN=Plabr_2420 PE=3 SV=1: PhoU [Gemmata massiliana]|uniref:PhoU domain-containing protein n=1 Tax=Gemmata massiliana TaxID=1210884 RepID=A0A6P2CXN8_9BACT|nr:PhoU domain-containing protein [Gemmata massiliana]VTR93761.1 Phosphate-specific transport system accessory protein PhoU OS=Planctomyces brasiliensis (strain ATCC 49424 / DSM 5305 / JCM 21570 / NBRC 103401 / IFAM 1448) GN=Plabr_2420 PE=3 SV=1: PhoU [Gemmata massiliana]